MKTIFVTLLAATLPVLFPFGCSPAATNLPTTSTPLSDAATASIESVCEHLSLPSIGCYPATAAGLASCVAGITNMTQLGFAPSVNLTCASTATSRTTATNCQGISCPAVTP